MRIFGAAVVLAVTGAASAQPLRVVTFDAARAGSCNGVSQDLVAGDRLTAVRSGLLNPANFGPGGVVGRQVAITAVHTLTAEALAGADVILLTTSTALEPDGPLMTPQEVALVGQFLDQGGGLFAFWNNGAEVLGPLFGLTNGPYGGQGCDGTTDSNPPVTGPFGSGAGCVSNMFRGRFLALPPGAAFASSELAARLQRGPGKAVIVNDEEWVWSSGELGCGIADWAPNKQTLFLNCVAYVVPTVPCMAFKAVTTQPQPQAACSGSAQFSVAAVGAGPLSYQWQLEASPGVWMSLGNDPGPLPDGGFAFATPMNSPAVTIGVNSPGALGRTRYGVRCLVSNSCGAIESAATQLFIRPADIGRQGGLVGADGQYDNNDFIAFINLFFASDPRADMGRQGGVFGSDGQFDNNDFIVFIDRFFAGC